MPQVVGFIGAGRMGEPMVVRLIGAGHRVVVLARRAEVRERLGACGAEVVRTIAEVAEAADVVVVCVFSDPQLIDVLGGPSGLLATAKPSTIVVSHTTGSVGTVRELAAAHPDGPVLLDGPVSGSAQDIAAGRLTVLLGGPGESAEAVRPVLESYSAQIIATGALGTALNVKLVNNALFAANSQLVAEAARVGRQLGIDDRDLLRALSACSGASHAAESIRRTGGLAAFEKAAAPFLRKDVAACLAATADAGADLGRLAAVIHNGPLELG
ncbi:NAD(P)-dependent oxidoreductase [Nocardia sp. NPDC057668]|uniref:NAD(P)-dependent oxidoreductase n=1 Tax=Nocardia sp. NPDC057668 TaxID=3346202 RepID=UPI003670B599